MSRQIESTNDRDESHNGCRGMNNKWRGASARIDALPPLVTDVVIVTLTLLIVLTAGVAIPALWSVPALLGAVVAGMWIAGTTGGRISKWRIAFFALLIALSLYVANWYWLCHDCPAYFLLQPVRMWGLMSG